MAFRYKLTRLPSFGMWSTWICKWSSPQHSAAFSQPACTPPLMKTAYIRSLLPLLQRRTRRASQDYWRGFFSYYRVRQLEFSKNSEFTKQKWIQAPRYPFVAETSKFRSYCSKLTDLFFVFLVWSQSTKMEMNDLPVGLQEGKVEGQKWLQFTVWLHLEVMWSRLFCFCRDACVWKLLLHLREHDELP